MLKKALSSILILTIIVSCITLPTVSANETFQIGDYIIIGQYNNEPIVWRYVLDDENGKLLTTDHIISWKRYGTDSTNYWANSYIRKWLNSSEEVWWEYKGEPFILYDGELGFLSNFTQAQLSLMKMTTQWTMVGSYSLSENDEKNFFTVVKEEPKQIGPGGDHSSPVYYDFEDIPSLYYGAAMKTTDKVFLMDALQVYNMKQNIGSATASLVGKEYTSPYWLRSRQGFEINLMGELSRWYVGDNGGIRPAIHLDESAIETMTGSGTKEDPYVLNARGDITVRLNGELLPSDQEPIIENGRTFVPFRAIFEALGAEVSWNGETQIATAKKEGLEIILQIGSNQMVVNGNVFFLDATPKIVHNRTLVPVRTVFKNLQATVDWDEDLRQVIIITE